MSTIHEDKINTDFLYERGFVPTIAVSSLNTIYNKWGIELDVHCNSRFCKANTLFLNDTNHFLSTKKELLDFEKKMNIDQTPVITKMSVGQLKSLLPSKFKYVLDKSKRHKKSKYNLSYTIENGRYKIIMDDEVIINGYNDEDEAYFLCRSILYILEKEGLLPSNTRQLKYYI